MEKRGTFWIIIGEMLLLAAILLSLYNLYEGKMAQKEAASVSEKIETEIMMLQTEKTEKQDEETVPAYILHPEMDMPIMEIEGELYVGYLEIPQLELVLPVAGGEWNDLKMKKTPCLYKGTAYMKNMIIVGHNYRSHFSGLKTLKMGTDIYFIDAEGNRFGYILEWTDIIEERDTAAMISGEEEWDLTLFTCTYGGNKRYTLRCVEK